MRSLDEPGELCMPSNGKVLRDTHFVISCSHSYMWAGQWQTSSLMPAFHTSTANLQRP